jgi:hypothetical protein
MFFALGDSDLSSRSRFKSIHISPRQQLAALDGNQDGKVDASDNGFADFNGDGTVDASDTVGALQGVAGFERERRDRGRRTVLARRARHRVDLVGSMQAGVPLNLVQRWLGHARISTTAPCFGMRTGRDDLCQTVLAEREHSGA